MSEQKQTTLLIEAQLTHLEEIRPNPETTTAHFSGLKETYHGLRAIISRWRMEHAGSRMERMDHKDALYASIGDIALSGVKPTDRKIPPTTSEEPPSPRTFIERTVDKRIDRKAYKKAIKDTYAYRSVKVFGPADSLPGMSNKDRRKAKREVAKAVRNSTMTATDARIAKTRIDTQPLKLGEGMHKRTSKGAKRASKMLGRAIAQPIGSAWRSQRRIKAIADIKRHHHRSEEHLAKQDEAFHKAQERDLIQIDKHTRRRELIKSRVREVKEGYDSREVKYHEIMPQVRTYGKLALLGLESALHHSRIHQLNKRTSHRHSQLS